MLLVIIINQKYKLTVHKPDKYTGRINNSIELEKNNGKSELRLNWLQYKHPQCMARVD